jgi:hypothetical protein
MRWFLILVASWFPFVAGVDAGSWQCVGPNGETLFSDRAIGEDCGPVGRSRPNPATTSGSTSERRPTPPSSRPSTQTSASSSDPIGRVVELAQSEGFVRRIEQDSRWINLYVAPSFHQLDYEQQRLTALAFMEWNKRTNPDAEMVFFFDSRDRKRLGKFDPVFGLKIERPRP